MITTLLAYRNWKWTGKCTKCKEDQASTKEILFKDLPELLILQIRRFQWDRYGMSVKETKEVEFSETLIINSMDAAHHYELSAFISHKGTTSGGHLHSKL